MEILRGDFIKLLFVVFSTVVNFRKGLDLANYYFYYNFKLKHNSNKCHKAYCSDYNKDYLQILLKLQKANVKIFLLDNYSMAYPNKEGYAPIIFESIIKIFTSFFLKFFIESLL